VQGYAGGTFDPEQNAYVVRESVAHSWPEVYFPGFGWQRFEPTPASYASPPTRPALPGDTDTESSAFGSSNLSDDVDRRTRELLELEERLNGSVGDLEASQRALAERLQVERTRRLVIGGGVVAALLAGLVLFFISLRRDIQGLSPATATYARLGRLAAWAGLPQKPHTTPYEYAGEIGRRLPAQRDVVDRIVDAYVTERYGSQARGDADQLERNWRTLRRSLLIRLAANLGASARPRSPLDQRRRRSTRQRR
jgi:hypothetical protein